jgi:hypothetical protein
LTTPATRFKSSIDVEQIEERGLGVDLIDKTAAVFRSGSEPAIHAILYTVDVENPARPRDRCRNRHAHVSFGRRRCRRRLPQPIELPPGATVESVEQTR